MNDIFQFPAMQIPYNISLALPLQKGLTFTDFDNISQGRDCNIVCSRKLIPPKQIVLHICTSG